MHPVYVIGKENSLAYEHAPIGDLAVSSVKLSSDVATTGRGSMRFVASRVAISYGRPASF
jgi:hypothetical protein